MYRQTPKVQDARRKTQDIDIDIDGGSDSEAGDLASTLKELGGMALTVTSASLAENLYEWRAERLRRNLDADVIRKCPAYMRAALESLNDNRDLITSGGAYWKKWRATINPGFNPRNLVAMIPHLIEEIEVFADEIRKMAGENGSWGPMFPLEDRTTDLTLDIILRAATYAISKSNQKEYLHADP